MPVNFTLIGMPGAGKSTVGYLLAKQMEFQFIDTDDLIQQQQNRTLQDIVNEEGYMQLRHFEEQAVHLIEAKNAVIATGGSTVYSPAAMEHLSSLSRIIYLSVSYEVIKGRIKDLDTRGLAKQPHQSLHDLYLERTGLYEKYAEITVQADREPGLVVESIKSAVSEL